eukprot:Phypoly_transcript_00747.p1 GENE.Phypoly_transcript_00747~~Phypoly_transcript_00747.p1  ORF type:complete len:979 (-),score=231.74 Phypoly_transcript_00747:42-2978(-)
MISRKKKQGKEMKRRRKRNQIRTMRAKKRARKKRRKRRERAKERVRRREKESARRKKKRKGRRKEKERPREKKKERERKKRRKNQLKQKEKEKKRNQRKRKEKVKRKKKRMLKKEKEKKKQKMREKREPTPEDVDRNARKYIKQFIFKIHPDFFHQDAAKKSANMHALQVLNSFLEVIRALKDPSSLPRDKIPAPFSVSFFVKDLEKPISTTFHLPKLPEGEISAVFVGLLRQRAYEGIADLISKAKIKVDEQDVWVIAGKDEQEKRDFAHSKLPKHWRPIGWSPTDEDYGLIEILMEHCRFIDFSQSLRESPFTRHQQEKLAMLVKEFFYFDSLTPEECERAVENFTNSVHLIQFDKWCRIPVVFSTRKGCERLRMTLEKEGFLAIPFDFELEELISYINKKLPAIKERREELVAQAKRDMQEVTAMKEQVMLALGPKSVTIEPAVDREKRKAQLARYLIRASRAADIEMGHQSNSILQNDYRQLEIQRQEDKEFIDRREGNFPLKTLEDLAMLPPVDPPRFTLPPHLSPSSNLPRLTSSSPPTAPNPPILSPSKSVPPVSSTPPLAPSSIPAPNQSTSSPSSSTSSSDTSSEDVVQLKAPPSTTLDSQSIILSHTSPEDVVQLKAPSDTALTQSGSRSEVELNNSASQGVVPSAPPLSDLDLQPITSIFPQALDINSDESVVGPRLGFGRDAAESPNLRIGYTGLLLDLDEDDRATAYETKTLEKYAGLAGSQDEKPTGMVSGEFYHGSSALHCLQHLASLAMTEMKTAFHWPAISIVVSDHYHMDINNGEPTLYVPCYFDVATLRKFMENEGGTALKKLKLEAEETDFLLRLSNKVRDKIGVSTVKISKELKENFQEQVAGLASLMTCADEFAKLGNVADVIVVVGTTFAFDQENELGRLFVPFDFEKKELEEYLETGILPEKYVQREKEKQKKLEMMGLEDTFFDNCVDYDEDTPGEEGFDEMCGDIPDGEGGL